MSTINDLFEQIICSEQAAQRRKNLLQDLRNNVFAEKQNGQQLEKAVFEQKETLAHMLHELSKQELTVKHLTCQESIYIKQRAQKETCVNEWLAKEKLLKEKLQENKINFCEELSNFCTCYGAFGSGFEHRDQKYRVQLENLQQEWKQLTTNLEVYKKRDARVQEACRERNSLAEQNQLQDDNKGNLELVSSLCKMLQETADLQEECHAITNIPYTDPAFTRRQRQLEEKKLLSVQLDTQCLQLQADFKKCQRTLRQLRKRHLQKQRQNLLADEMESNEKVKEEIFSEADEGEGHPVVPADEPKIQPSRKSIFKL